MKKVLKIGLVCFGVWALINAVGRLLMGQKGEQEDACCSGETRCPAKKLAGKVCSLFHGRPSCQ